MQRLVLVVAVPLILMLAVAVAGISSSCGSITETMVRHELQAAQYAFEVSVNNIAAGSYMYTNGKFYKGKRNISDNTQFFDNFSQEVDLQVTVFFGNVRVATSLIDEDGNRMVGTEADPEVYEIVVNQGQDYYADNVEIGGGRYYRHDLCGIEERYGLFHLYIKFHEEFHYSACYFCGRTDLYYIFS